MWWYESINRNKSLLFSLYVILFIWSCVTIDWKYFQEILAQLEMIIPVVLSLIVVGIIIFLSKKRFYYFLFTILSTIPITLAIVELFVTKSVLQEAVSAVVFLITMTGIIHVWVTERNPLFIMVGGKAILYSTLLVILLHITPILIHLSPLFYFLFVGQIVSYFASLLFLPSEKEWQEHTKKRARVKQEKQQRYRPRILFYVIGVVAAVFLLQLDGFVVPLGAIYLYSFFLSIGLFTSISRVVLVHLFLPSIFLVIFISQMVMTYFSSLPFSYPLVMSHEVWVGILLFWAYGMFPLFMWNYSTYLKGRVYFVSSLLFLGGLSPIIALRFLEIGDRWVTLTVMIGYIIVNGTSVLLLSDFTSGVFKENKRADRPYQSSDILEDSETYEELYLKKEWTEGERERHLVRTYSRLLEHREERIDQFFSKNND